MILADDTGSTDTAYTDTTATPKTSYVYRVRAVNTHGQSEISNRAEIFFRPVMPGRPSGLSAKVDNSGTAIALTWKAPTEGGTPSGYQIMRRAPATEANFVILADDTGSRDTAYTDSTATPKTSYVYRVRAVNTHGQSEISNRAEIFFRPVMPGRPSGLSAKVDNSGTAIALTWKAPTEGGTPSGYQIMRRAPATEANFVILTDNTGSTDTAYTDSTATPKTSYVYRVRAVNTHGQSEISNRAEIFFRPVMPGRPSDLSAKVDDSGTAIALTWKAPTEGGTPSGYQILRRATATEANFVILADDTGSITTAYADSTAVPDIKYVYRVKARNAAGLGQESRPAYASR